MNLIDIFNFYPHRKACWKYNNRKSGDVIDDFTREYFAL